MDSVLSILSSVLSICCSRSSSEDGFNSLEAQAHQSSSSTSYSSSSTTDGWSYDVFLSFRGEDTRKNFTDHLYTALERAGVKTFRDDKLKRGEPISPSLLKAIENSRSSIVVFSRNYASSKWCLEELAKMVECRDRNGQTLFPIFFDVDPSDVRNQTGSFAKAFCQHKKRFEKEKVERWRGALREVGQLSGWSLKDVANGHESKLIPLVLKEVLREQNKTTFDVAKHPVGIDSRVDEMMSFLQVESSNVLFVGIWGLGGIGKTTIAQAVHNKIRGGFQCSCFLADIRAVASEKGLVTLQKQLLNNLNEGSEDINDDSRVKTAIKARLCSKKVLLILDDVDDRKQLDALAGKPDWFGPGSRIIITTRDEHVLNVHEVGLIYKPEELDFDQSLQLFNKHAFCRDQPPEDYRELSERAVRIAGGLPLALEVFGSFLFNKETTEWENALDKLKKIPLKEIQERLKLSYEGLDDFEKEIFLDIACFFIGMDIEVAITILEGCGFYSRIGIKVLVHKSLVKINDYNRLTMHDQIRDMGREIIRQQNWKEPGMRSRLWLHDEALGVLMKQTGTGRIEGIRIGFERIRLKLSIEAFALMSKLRLLEIDHADLEGEFHHLPKELRWLSWNGCPLEYLPTTFHLGELVALELRNSHITQVRNCLHQNKLVLEKLKVLDLRFCLSLTRTSDLSGLPCLERLILSWCDQLVEVDESIAHLKRLVFLDLVYCKKLMELPSSICKLKCLKILLLSGCHNLYELPENLGTMESLTELSVEYTGINQLPDSIGILKNLTRLSLERCTSVRKIPDFIWRIESLIELNLARTELEEIPDFCLPQTKIQVLNARYCKLFSRLPDSIGSFRNLKSLYIEDTIIAELPNSVGSLEKLEELTASNCKKLVKLPDSMGKMRSLKLFVINKTGIFKLPEDFGMLSSLKKLKMDDCRGFIGFFPVSFSCLCSLEELCASNCNLSEGGIPSDFGRLSSLKILELKGNKFCSLPASINALSRLQTLDLTECKMLHSLPELPSSLTHLHARHCISMERLPNLSNLKRLNSLHLEECVKLEKIQGLKGLESLELLQVQGASSEILFDSLNLKRLNTLLLSNCEELDKIQVLENLETLEHLQVVCSSIERLPDISNLKRLKKLLLSDCEKLAKIQGLEGYEALEVLDMMGCTSIERLPSLSNLKGLKTLRLNNCGKLAEIQGLEGCEALELLDMKRCTSTERLSDLSKLKRLKKLLLSDCEKLAKIQGLEGCEALEVLDMMGCTSTERLSDLSNLKRLKKIKLQNCDNLAEIQGLEGLVALEGLWLTKCTSIERLPDLSNLKGLKTLLLSECEKLAEIQGLEGLESLEVLNMHGFTSIERLPNLSKLKKLKKLHLQNCEKLVEIQGLEGLKSLYVLEMQSCKSMDRLQDLLMLKKLERLWFINCDVLTAIQGLEGLEALEDMVMYRCSSIERLPDLSKLKRLKKLKLLNCEKLTKVQGLDGLEALEVLVIYKCSSIGRLPDLSKLKRLKKLELLNCENLTEIQGLDGLEALEVLQMWRFHSIERLSDLSNLKRLTKLELINCEKLAEIQGLEDLEALEELYLRRCTSIERLPDLSNLKELTILDLTDCRNLAKIQRNEKRKALKELYIGGCSSALANSLKNSLVPGVIECLSTLIFPGSKIPDWFTPAKLSHDGENRTRLYCEVPPGRALLNPEQRRQQHKIKIIGVMLCFVFANQEGEDSAIWVGVDVKRNGKNVFSSESLSHLWVPQTHQEDQLYFYHFEEDEEDPQGKKLFSILEEGGEVSFKMKLRVKKAGVCVAYK